MKKPTFWKPYPEDIRTQAPQGGTRRAVIAFGDQLKLIRVTIVDGVFQQITAQGLKFWRDIMFGHFVEIRQDTTFEMWHYLLELVNFARRERYFVYFAYNSNAFKSLVLQLVSRELIETVKKDFEFSIVTTRRSSSVEEEVQVLYGKRFENRAVWNYDYLSRVEPQTAEATAFLFTLIEAINNRRRPKRQLNYFRSFGDV